LTGSHSLEVMSHELEADSRSEARSQSRKYVISAPAELTDSHSLEVMSHELEADSWSEARSQESEVRALRCIVRSCYLATTGGDITE
jgi:hypothetical protein